MYIVAGAAAHSSFKKTQLLNRLASMSSVQSFDSQWVYLFDQALNEQQYQAALQLLNDGQSFALRQALQSSRCAGVCHGWQALRQCRTTGRGGRRRSATGCSGDRPRPAEC